MNKKGKALIGIVSALLVILIVWAVNSIPEPPGDGGELDKRVVNFDGNTIREEKDGRVIWTVTAESIDMDIDTKDVFLKDMKAVYNFEDGRNVELRAAKAIYRDKTHNLEILDGVEGQSSDGGKFSCKEVEWLHDKDMLVMKGEAKIDYEQAHVKASGDRIESSDGFNKFKVIGKAHLEKGN
ncbi:protein of unknown function DUF1239 [Anaerovibrio sp. JC8]|uniref:LPS export ABC transporter periplasmic protein LptC n=1 Tax=Anaerovibrio sp. JC8 TaxID=1240085 RepID=UPI000A0BC893|nr:LPS export ABC transporter periplasmic protein LptC [Anaerovibrio sp. JC8]ORU00937.1 protein of unknown function DUF1239 [Anaerovibrio sp. JC8]